LESTPISLEAHFFKMRFQREEESFTLHAVFMNASCYVASIIDQPKEENEGRSTIAQLTHDHHAFLGCNGGCFSSRFEPEGLCVIDGTQVSNPSRKSIFSGMLLIDKRGMPSLHWFNRNDHPAPNALQGGPFLIEPGGVIGVLPADGPIAKRTVLVQAEDKFGVIVTSEVSLFNLAFCLKKKCDSLDMTIDRALNLDGGPSSGLCLDSKEVKIDLPPHWPVRNVLIFRAR